MEKKSKLEISVLGGRSFGKTSLISSMILVSGSKDSGITVSGSNQKKLNVYNDYKNNNGTLEATSWAEIYDFKYNITDKTNDQTKRWQLTFIDYPGEFFQKFSEDGSNAFSNLLKKTVRTETSEHNKTTESQARSFTQEEEKNARKLIKKFEGSDALIVLLPADIRQSEHMKNLQVFKTLIQALLEKIQKRHPHIPVCLAINKWDMFGKSYEDLDSVLQTEPYREFNDMMSRENSENYFCQAVSAFGNNKAAAENAEATNKEMLQQWDGEGKPLNVLEMMIRLAKMAEVARFRHLREQYDKANLAARIFLYPFRFLCAYGKGANLKDDRVFCSTKLLATMGMLTGTLAVAAACLLGTMSAAISIHDYRYISEQAEASKRILGKLASSAEPGFNTDIARIQQFKSDLAGHPRKLAFFCKDKTKDAAANIQAVEEAYNRRVFALADGFCNREENQDHSAQKMLSNERMSRCQKRRAKWAEALTMLTKMPTKCFGNGREIVDVINEKIDAENRLEDAIKTESPFDDKLHELSQLDDEIKCVYIEEIIDQLKSRFPNRSLDFDNLQQELENREKTFQDILLNDLDKIPDIPNSLDSAERIQRAKSRIERIQREKKHLSKRSKYHQQHENEIKKINHTIYQIEHDSVFYIAYSELLNKPPQGKIRHIDDFLRVYNVVDYPRCELYIEKAVQERKALIAEEKAKLQAVLDQNQIEERLPATEKSRRLELRKKAYEAAKTQYSLASDDYIDADRQINDIDIKLDIEATNAKFETAYTSLMENQDNGKLKLIAAFRNDFKAEVYPSKRDNFDKIDNEEKRLLEKWDATKAKSEKNFADDLELSAEERVNKLNILIGDYEKLKSELPEVHQKFEKINEDIIETKNNVARLALYMAFDSKLAEIDRMSDYDKPKALNAFIIEFNTITLTEKKYKDKLIECGNQYDKLKEKLKNEHNVEKIKLLDESEGKTWENKVSLYKKVIELTNRYKSFFPDGEASYFIAIITACQKTIDNLERSGHLNDEYEKLDCGEPCQTYNAIVKFTIKFKRSDYLDDPKLFDKVIEKLKSVEILITKAYDKEIDITREMDPKNFDMNLQHLTNCINVSDKYLKQIDVNTDLWAKIKKTRSDFEHEHQKQQRFAKITRSGEPLLSENGLSSIDTAERRLSEIRSFKGQHPRENNAEQELSTFYDKIDKMQGEVENFIGNDLEEQLSKIIQDLPPAPTNEQKIENLKKQLDILNKKTAIMLKDSKLYLLYNARTVEVQNHLGEVELRNRFIAEDDKLNNVIKMEISISEKIIEIDNFIGRFKHYEKFEQSIKVWRNYCEQLQQDQTWANFSKEVNEMIQNKPTGTNIANYEYIDYRNKVNEKREKIKEYLKIDHINQSVQNLDNKLDNELKWIQKQIGDGTLVDIRNKEDKYKEDPNEVNAFKLKQAIEGFDKEKFPKTEEQVRNIKKGFDDDQKKRKALITVLKNYRVKPSKDNFIDLYESFNSLKSYREGTTPMTGYGASCEEIKKIKLYISKLSEGIDIKIDLTTASLNKKWNGLKFKVEFDPKNDSQSPKEFVVTTTNNKLGEKNSSDNNWKWDKGNRFELIKLPQNTDVKLTVTFDNKTSYEDFCDTKPYWDIIHLGVSTDKTLKFTGTPEGTKAYLQFQISGVPEVPELK